MQEKGFTAHTNNFINDKKKDLKVGAAIVENSMEFP